MRHIEDHEWANLFELVETVLSTFQMHALARGLEGDGLGSPLNSFPTMARVFDSDGRLTTDGKESIKQSATEALARLNDVFKEGTKSSAGQMAISMAGDPRFTSFVRDQLKVHLGKEEDAQLPWSAYGNGNREEES